MKNTALLLLLFFTLSCSKDAPQSAQTPPLPAIHTEIMDYLKSGGDPHKLKQVFPSEGRQEDVIKGLAQGNVVEPNYHLYSYKVGQYRFTIILGYAYLDGQYSHFDYAVADRGTPVTTVLHQDYRYRLYETVDDQEVFTGLKKTPSDFRYYAPVEFYNPLDLANFQPRFTHHRPDNPLVGQYIATALTQNIHTGQICIHTAKQTANGLAEYQSFEVPIVAGDVYASYPVSIGVYSIDYANQIYRFEFTNAQGARVVTDGRPSECTFTSTFGG